MKFFDMSDDEDVDQFSSRTLQRRMFLYSETALDVAREVESIYIQHTDFRECIQLCDRIYQRSRQLSSTMGGIIAGPPGSGKSTVAQYFTRSLPQSDLFEKGMGAVRIRLPRRPSAGHFVASLLGALKYPFRRTSNSLVHAQQLLAIDVIKQKGTKLLFIDDAQHLLAAARESKRKGEIVSALLGEILDETGTGLVLFSSEDVADLADLEPSLASRLATRLNLKNFASDPVWRAFLRAMAGQSKVFDLILLATEDVAEKTHRATGGNLRALRFLVTEAVLVAMDSGEQKLSMDALRVGFDRVFGSATETSNPYATK